MMQDDDVLVQAANKVLQLRRRQELAIVDKQGIICSSRAFQERTKARQCGRIDLIEHRTVRANRGFQTRSVELRCLVHQQTIVEYLPGEIARYELLFDNERHTTFSSEDVTKIFFRLEHNLAELGVG